MHRSRLLSFLVGALSLVVVTAPSLASTPVRFQQLPLDADLIVNVSSYDAVKESLKALKRAYKDAKELPDSPEKEATLKGMKRQIEELEDTLREEQRRERAEEKERKKAEKEAREQEEKERERVAQENNIEPPKKRKSKRELRKEKEEREKSNAEVDQAQQGSGQPDTQPDSEPFPPSVESDTGESITPKSESRSERKRRLRAEQKQKKLRKQDEEQESNTTTSADIDEPPKTKKRKRELRKEKLEQEKWKQQQLEAQGEEAPLQTQTEADVQSTEIPKPKLSKKKRELRKEKLAQEKWKKEVAEKERQSQIAAIEREARKKQKELDALRLQEEEEQTQPAPDWKKKAGRPINEPEVEVASPSATPPSSDNAPKKFTSTDDAWTQHPKYPGIVYIDTEDGDRIFQAKESATKFEKAYVVAKLAASKTAVDGYVEGLKGVVKRPLKEAIDLGSAAQKTLTKPFDPNAEKRFEEQQAYNDWLNPQNEMQQKGGDAFDLGSTITPMGGSLKVTKLTRFAFLKLKNPKVKWSYSQDNFQEEFQHGRYLTETHNLPIETIDDLANAVRYRKIDPVNVPVHIIREGDIVYVLNTRTAKALERAGVPREDWSLIDATSDHRAQEALDKNLAGSKFSRGEIIYEIYKRK